MAREGHIDTMSDANSAAPNWIPKDGRTRSQQMYRCGGGEVSPDGLKSSFVITPIRKSMSVSPSRVSFLMKRAISEVQDLFFGNGGLFVPLVLIGFGVRAEGAKGNGIAL